MNLPVHFASNSKLLCDSDSPKRLGALVNKFRRYEKYRERHSDAKFLYTTSDEYLTCEKCIHERIYFHTEAISKLRSKIP